MLETEKGVVSSESWGSSDIRQMHRAIMLRYHDDKLPQHIRQKIVQGERTDIDNCKRILHTQNAFLNPWFDASRSAGVVVEPPEVKGLQTFMRWEGGKDGAEISIMKVDDALRANRYAFMDTIVRFLLDGEQPERQSPSRPQAASPDNSETSWLRAYPREWWQTLLSLKTDALAFDAVWNTDIRFSVDTKRGAPQQVYRMWSVAADAFSRIALRNHFFPKSLTIVLSTDTQKTHFEKSPDGTMKCYIGAQATWQEVYNSSIGFL